jgi:2-keto-4-pentenoate hydratase/2-oxohepta-3-ene-1,7-dioic acid hydratase in catechol pathway
VEAGVELAFVVGRLASKVRREDAADYILGYAPMITLADQSFLEQVVEPATGQERNSSRCIADGGTI